jgi:lipopolysaccharide transport system ATP-binding protein
MSEVILQVQDLSKMYQLGVIGSGSLKRDLQNWWSTKILKKENPFFQIPSDDVLNASKDFIWALREVSFEVKQGEAWGIIGSNGSGKSTLLKIISRIINPTKGYVRGKGKVSSLLEVGTGFNPEFTGRQNIYMSGYILGMSKQEIKKKFDEIVDFSGVEKFLDTPVKRYSSGMYMRLAFAVAAHLEPDILIVDEVLAVGDVDFQKKCMGKMQEVSNNSGRTILFVSHNLQAVANLCNKTLWLNKGKASAIGETSGVINTYLTSLKNDPKQEWAAPDHAPGNTQLRLKSASARPHGETSGTLITVNTPIQLDFEFWCFLDNCSLNVNVILLTEKRECVFNLGTHSVQAEKGILALTSIIPKNLLNNSGYSVSLLVIKNHNTNVHEFIDCISFEVEDVREGMYYYGEWPGIIRPKIDSYIYMKETVEKVATT